MESSLTNACILKIENFEGPFDLLFHLLEKNKINIYDIPISEITDQYMDYLYAMKSLDIEIASEFLLMASTLLHIKSKMLLPSKKEKEDEEEKDPREELVARLIEYKKFKAISEIFKEKEVQWNRVYYKLPETVEIQREDEILNLSPETLVSMYENILNKYKNRMNTGTSNKMVQILKVEKVSLRLKMKEIIKTLKNRVYVGFFEMFSLKKKSRMEVVTGFLAILELSKMKKVRLKQKKPFSEILIYKSNDSQTDDAEINENSKILNYYT